MAANPLHINCHYFHKELVAFRFPLGCGSLQSSFHFVATNTGPLPHTFVWARTCLFCLLTCSTLNETSNHLALPPCNYKKLICTPLCSHGDDMTSHVLFTYAHVLQDLCMLAVCMCQSLAGYLYLLLSVWLCSRHALLKVMWSYFPS